jgi:hypothetical protein
MCSWSTKLEQNFRPHRTRDKARELLDGLRPAYQSLSLAERKVMNSVVCHIGARTTVEELNSNNLTFRSSVSVKACGGDLKMSLRNAGLLFIVAAALFWFSWFLMPGVGVTDAARIFELVGHKRASVMLSVVTQLLSSALYVPALLGISGAMSSVYGAGVRWGTGLLLVGAMGSAMDAVFHLLAYAMTAPGLEPTSLLRVMAFMQGPALRIVGPFIVSFFLGVVFLSIGLRKKGAISKASEYLQMTALGIVVAGSASGGIVSKRAVGLLVLGAISMAQAAIGFELSWPSGRFAWNRDQFSRPSMAKQI